jgi:hypothetical protein
VNSMSAPPPHLPLLTILTVSVRLGRFSTRLCDRAAPKRALVRSEFKVAGVRYGLPGRRSQGRSRLKSEVIRQTVSGPNMCAEAAIDGSVAELRRGGRAYALISEFPHISLKRMAPVGLLTEQESELPNCAFCLTVLFPRLPSKSGANWLIQKRSCGFYQVGYVWKSEESIASRSKRNRTPWRFGFDSIHLTLGTRI